MLERASGRGRVAHRRFVTTAYVHDDDATTDKHARTRDDDNVTAVVVVICVVDWFPSPGPGAGGREGTSS